MLPDPDALNQGLVKGGKLCLLTLLAGLRSELAGCRSALSMLKIKVRISETKYRSFYKTLSVTHGWGIYVLFEFYLLRNYLLDYMLLTDKILETGILTTELNQLCDSQTESMG